MTDNKTATVEKISLSPKVKIGLLIINNDLVIISKVLFQNVSFVVYFYWEQKERRKEFDLTALNQVNIGAS